MSQVLPAPVVRIPLAASPRRIMWRNTAVLVSIHLLALLALLPCFFSWTGVVLALLGHYLFGLLGITLGYHRLLTHRGLSCSRRFEHVLALFGVCCLQDTPARWVAIHRQHHQFSDEQNDPHSPLVAFIWGHFGWLLVENREHNQLAFLDRYAHDLLQDPFYIRLERRNNSFKIYALHALFYFLAGLGAGYLLTGNVSDSLYFASSVLIWGVFIRTLTVWHSTWSVNSLAHIWGYRNYATDDKSRNNWFVALVAIGEGWHNNHHHDQRSAAHGHRPWEIDLTWSAVRLLEKLGLVHDVIRPRAAAARPMSSASK